jgi:phosphoglycerol transferase MdoB-like AlkP superfamily enzyme
VDADIVIRWEDVTEFDAAVRATTALALLDEPLPDDGDPETVPLTELARETTRVGFEALESAASRPGPTYVFAHILVPHPPYVWDADGSIPTAEEADVRTEEEEYAAQLAWTNQRVLQAVDRLLAAPAGEEPIIVLQADEGPYPERFRVIGYPFKWFNATDEEVEQKFAILNAVHLPGVDPEAAGFSDHTSPVNNFRIVFNAFFGADLPLHPDVSYLSLDTFRPLELREVRRR